MDSIEITDAIREFGEIVDKMVSEVPGGGENNSLGNQILFVNNQETGDPSVVGVCLVIPCKEYGTLFVRLMVDGNISYYKTVSGELDEIHIEDVEQENIKKLHSILVLVGVQVAFSCIMNFVGDQGKKVSAAYVAANILSKKMNGVQENDTPQEDAPKETSQPKVKKTISIAE